MVARLARVSGVYSARKRAFSIIELLVVIGIIGLLLSILIPSIRAARAHARLTVCLTNLRAQGAALQRYAAVYDGQLPPKRVIDNKQADGEQIDLIDGVMSAFLNNNPPAVHGPEIPNGVWRCPDVLWGEDDEVRRTPSGILHYAPNTWLYNDVVIAKDGTIAVEGDAPEGWETRYGGPQWRKLDQVRRQADVIAMVDNVSYYNEPNARVEARESIGLSCEVAYTPGGGDCGENVGSHADLSRRPAGFLDSHAAPLPDSRAYWNDLLDYYRPTGFRPHNIALWQREVQHFLWFVEPAEYMGPVVPEE